MAALGISADVKRQGSANHWTDLNRLINLWLNWNMTHQRELVLGPFVTKALNIQTYHLTYFQ